MSSIFDKLFIGIQYVLPARLLGACTYRLARSRITWLKNLLIRSFTRLFMINESEMDRGRATDYPTFNAFFTRELKPGARPVDDDPHSVCSPADGRVQQAGQVSYGRMIQAKGMTFSAGELLNAEPADVEPFDGGAFMTIYLAPHNYHRVHAPLGGNLRRMHFIPGSRFSVNRATADSIPGLFARNERVACLFDSSNGPFWLVFVGAMNVASISTTWAGEILGGREPKETVFAAETGPAFKKGDCIGHFNLGSTVIIIFPRNIVSWDQSLQPQSELTVGRRIGTL